MSCAGVEEGNSIALVDADNSADGGGGIAFEHKQESKKMVPRPIFNNSRICATLQPSCNYLIRVSLDYACWRRRQLARRLIVTLSHLFHTVGP
jgi:hypothetical protein